MDVNDYMPSLLNPRRYKKISDSSTQNSVLSHCSLSLNKRIELLDNVEAITSNISKVKSNRNENKENEQCQLNNFQNVTKNCKQKLNDTGCITYNSASSLDFSGIIKVLAEGNALQYSGSADKHNSNNRNHSRNINDCGNLQSLRSDLNECKTESVTKAIIMKPAINVSFRVFDCCSVDVNSNKSAIKRVVVSNKNDSTNVDCELSENSHPSTDNGHDVTMNKMTSPNSVVVNLEIKKKLSTEDTSKNLKVLILNTTDIGKLTDVTVQPQNYNIVKRKIVDTDNYIPCKKIALSSTQQDKNLVSSNKKQTLIDSFYPNQTHCVNLIESGNNNNASNVDVMSKNSGVNNALKSELVGRLTTRSVGKGNVSPTSMRVASSKRESRYSPIHEIKTSYYETRRITSPTAKNESLTSHSPRKNAESVYFNLPARSKSNKTTISPRIIPHHKIISGTHFAVDAFSYGEIPNVKHYFLSHFHSDHYAGLKKSFNKLLYCSKITADLCISRLGVSSKYVHIINVEESMKVEGVDVTAVNANHCPGAIMFLFTLPNGRTVLHTGDFRATPAMESYPVFWNKDIHTIYLDTTYCNPRCDFPTQDQSLEMAWYILRQKKIILERCGKKFSSVLIVCGTYTIGKEKFFLGMARLMGCSVWACPEKDRVLQIVEGRSFSHAPPQSCQLHVVPMRDLTLDKLRSYLDSLKGAFNEVVAFKPSGWENGKDAAVEKDMVTIHGIPYSEHSSFSELIRFVKYLKPKQVIPTVDISGGIKSVQKYFPCPLVYKDDVQCQSKVTDFFNKHKRTQQVPAIT